MEENNKLTPDQEREIAASRRDSAYSDRVFTSERSSEVAIEYVRLEVQIATILFVFIGLFVHSFSDGGVLHSFRMQIMLAVALAALITSLLMGLIHLKRQEKFWDERMKQKALRFSEWTKVIKKETTYKEALAFHEGTKMGDDRWVSPPLWTWILQSAFLGTGIVLLFALFLEYLFRS